MSEVAWRALERTALAMGTREGTMPEDDPLTRSISHRAQARGRREGRSEMLASNVHMVLNSRDIEVTSDLAELRELLGALSRDAAMTAALACTDADDFRRRVGERLRDSDSMRAAGGIRPRR